MEHQELKTVAEVEHHKRVQVLHLFLNQEEVKEEMVQQIQ